MKQTAQKLEKVNLMVAAFFLALLVGPNVMVSIGKLEGKLFPVLDPMLTIMNIEAADPGINTTTKMDGRAYKKRECTYIAGSLRWYLGKPGGAYIEIDANFTDPPKLRENEEWTDWEGIIVDLNLVEVQQNSFATVQHDCGLPWPTESMFFNSWLPKEKQGPNSPDELVPQ